MEVKVFPLLKTKGARSALHMRQNGIWGVKLGETGRRYLEVWVPTYL